MVFKIAKGKQSFAVRALDPPRRAAFAAQLIKLSWNSTSLPTENATMQHFIFLFAEISAPTTIKSQSITRRIRL